MYSSKLQIKISLEPAGKVISVCNFNFAYLHLYVLRYVLTYFCLLSINTCNTLKIKMVIIYYVTGIQKKITFYNNNYWAITKFRALLYLVLII